jgi:hypothetical protein
MNRRTFLGQGIAVGAAAVSLRGAAPVSAANKPAPSTKPTADLSANGALTPAWAKGPTSHWVPLVQTGWNIYAVRFVDPPTFTWKPLPGATAYVVQYALATDKAARTVRLDAPTYDMSKDWAALAPGCIDMIAWAVDAQDRQLSVAWRKRFWKSRDFDGVRQDPLDYAASLHANVAYLLAPARDEVQDYERGLPRSVWSATEDSMTGQRRVLAFPALHHSTFVLALIGYARAFPDSPLAAEAMKQAKQYGDWLLENRLPADWYCGMFPFSTIQNGRFEGLVEGRNITLFRSSRVGEAMLAMFRQFDDERYLAYAKHLADAYIRMQRADGSWPYRVDPKDGKVVEDYTSNAVSPARFLGLMEQVSPNEAYRAARERAARWVMENPVKTRRWQGMFEDVGQAPPFRNLQHYDADEMVRYLVHYRAQDPSFVATAEQLNRYIEDQFVIFQEGDPAIADWCPANTVLEQYTCYRPMESHTGRWLLSLLALHRATGKQIYLDKAIAAGNAIVRGQHPQSGAYSTWGFDTRFGRSLLTLDWPGCNAFAVDALLHLSAYLKSPEQARQDEQPL